MGSRVVVAFSQGEALAVLALVVSKVESEDDRSGWPKVITKLRDGLDYARNRDKEKAATGA